MDTPSRLRQKSRNSSMGGGGSGGEGGVSRGREFDKKKNTSKPYGLGPHIFGVKVDFLRRVQREGIFLIVKFQPGRRVRRVLS